MRTSYTRRLKAKIKKPIMSYQEISGRMKTKL
jgi:hypothetical protein